MGYKKSTITLKKSDKSFGYLNNDLEFKKLIELLPEFVGRTDSDFNITFLNQNGLKAFGYKKKDIKHGLSLFDLVRYEEREKARENIKILIEKKRIKLNEYTALRKDGSTFQILSNSNVIENDDGTFAGLRMVAMDLTEKNNVREKIKENEQKYHFLTEYVNDIVFVQDMDCNFKYASPSAGNLLGYDMKNLKNYKMKDIMTRDSYSKAINSFKAYAKLALKDIDVNIPLMEYEYIKKDGSIFCGELKVRFLNDTNGNLTGVLGILRDISERKKAEENLKFLSFHDSLTGLYNRAYFEEALVRLDTERQLPLSIIMGDVNGLKLVNDAFGHVRGDLHLCSIARILEECCRKEDIVARLGGDEFSIILPKTNKSHAYKITRRIIDAMNKIKEEKILFSMSLGVSTRESLNQDIRSVMQAAEDNMYNSKLVERKSISSSIIATLERTLWEKSHETREHAGRIEILALKLGNAINLYKDKLDELALLSTLHDIGKIAIPEDIINKNQKLTSEEWKIIKKHPEIGYNICESSPQLVSISEAVLAHHEWWNGSGYPLGLKNKDIPITSRILAIVDAYDVMITGRSYKKPFSIDEALKELEKNAGTQFDPELVKKFIEILKENRK